MQEPNRTTLNKFDSFLREGPTKYAMVYIESGLDVAFNQNSKNKYKKVMKSDKEFQEFVEYTSHLSDQATNMDW